MSQSAVVRQIPVKKRGHACDKCKKTKVGCDGKTPCATCAAVGLACAYSEASQPPRRRTVHYTNEYVQRLEERLEAVHKLFQVRTLQAADGSRFRKDTWMHENGPVTSTPPCPAGCYPLTDALDDPPRPPQDEELHPDTSDDESDDGLLVTAQKDPRADSCASCFLGRSSNARTVQTLWDLKSRGTGRAGDEARAAQSHMPQSGRPEYWRLCPWEQPMFLPSPDTWEVRVAASYGFPGDDLLRALVDLYFARVNIFLPLLHRPSFRQAVDDGLHRRDTGFAINLLVVCALGAQHSDDPRVLLDGSHSSAGWTWFRQVQQHVMSVPTMARARLCDLQMYCLSVMFLQASCNASAMWSLVGLGIRLGQEVGAHRRRSYKRTPTVEDEPWKRAFWVLVYLDRSVAYWTGRSIAIQDEDFDLDLPACCDDEYWAPDDPARAFQQPPDKPSYVAFFVCMIKLYRVLSVALRTIYSIRKCKLSFGLVGPLWEGRMASVLGSALDKWMKAVPYHLRWDPQMKDDTFFNQSAMLYTTHFHVHILVHRPFSNAERMASPKASARSSCRDAAHACSQIVGALVRRNGISMSQHGVSAFTAGVILAADLARAKQVGGPADLRRVLDDVYQCIDVLDAHRSKWHFAAPFYDLLCDLLQLGNWPLPELATKMQDVYEKNGASPTEDGHRTADNGSVSGSANASHGPPRPTSPAKNSGAEFPPWARGFPSPGARSHAPESSPAHILDDPSVAMWAGMVMPNLELDDWSGYFDFLGAAGFA